MHFQSFSYASVISILFIYFFCSDSANTIIPLQIYLKNGELIPHLTLGTIVCMLIRIHDSKIIYLALTESPILPAVSIPLP